MDCSVSDCTRPRKARGYCTTHYYRLRNGLDITAPVARKGRGCAVVACDRPHVANGWCGQHNRRARLNGGDPGSTPIRGSADEMFWSYVDKSGGPDACWPWTSGLDKGGYGCAADGKGGGTGAHRRALELDGRPAPPRTPVDHTCHDPRVCQPGPQCPHRRCCNPAHLEVVTYAENWHRGGLALGITQSL